MSSSVLPQLIAIIGSARLFPALARRLGVVVDMGPTLGVPPPKVFTVLAVMAVTTTRMTGPVLCTAGEPATAA